MIECAIGFRPKAKDVVTLTTPKTGQTWLLAQLRMLSIGKVSIDELPPRLSRAGGTSPRTLWFTIIITVSTRIYLHTVSGKGITPLSRPVTTTHTVSSPRATGAHNHHQDVMKLTWRARTSQRI